MKKIYLASPLGFSEAGRLFMYEKMIPALEQANYEILDPWVLTPEEKINKVTNMKYGEKRRDAWRELNHQIGNSNAEAIREADLLVAVLDGVDVDSGTASEIGFAAGLGKPVYGYRGDFRLAGDNEGAIVNLQVEYFIRSTGGTIAANLEQLLLILR